MCVTFLKQQLSRNSALKKLDWNFDHFFVDSDPLSSHPLARPSSRVQLVKLVVRLTLTIVHILLAPYAAGRWVLILIFTIGVVSVAALNTWVSLQTNRLHGKLFKVSKNIFAPVEFFICSSVLAHLPLRLQRSSLGMY